MNHGVIVLSAYPETKDTWYVYKVYIVREKGVMKHILDSTSYSSEVIETILM
jgi:hypothetical protein